MIGIFRRLFKQESTELTDGESRRYKIELCSKRIAELEREYLNIIQKPYQAGRLSEIISQLGTMWNARLRYEDIKSAVNGNGAKNLWQVQNEVKDIVQEAKHHIAISKGSDDKNTIFIEGLLKLRHVLEEWETEL